MELFKKFGFRVVELADRDIEELEDRGPGNESLERYFSSQYIQTSK